MLRKIFLTFLLLACGFISPAHAIMNIDITKGNTEPMPIAISDLSGVEGNMAQIGGNISGVVAADLERSGLFRPIDKASFIEKVSGSTMPNFASWRQINATGLVTGSVKNAANGEVEVEFRLWDVYAGQQIAGRSYVTSPANWRRISHLIADEIYKRLTGESGYFDTRIVYIAESGPATRRIKRLAIMDQDGENHKYLTDGKSMMLTPRFSPTVQQVIYLSYAHNKPRVYIRDIESGRERIIGDFPGMSFAPRFAPNGDKAVMSVASGGSSNIYVLDMATATKVKITSDFSINTSPSYAPDGGKIVFNSDRGGSQQLYVMDSSGGNPQRISFGTGNYSTPVWSPRGDLIAFTKQQSGTFYIGVMRPDGSGERLLTKAFLVEGPTWAPNGRVIMYTKQNRGGAPHIYSIDLTGSNEREIVTPGDASDPAWSPLLQ
jgi:TolB protein